MKFKLDENVDPDLKQAFITAGHDCLTITDQNMRGWGDADILVELATERRCLVTIDLDFSNPFVFPPAEYSGIIVLRAPRSTFAVFESLVAEVLQEVDSLDPTGQLWIVEPGRIRVHQD